MHAALRIALEKPVRRRASRVALVVGVLLTAINQGDLLLSGVVTTAMVLKIALTFAVPYLVSTVTSVQLLSEQRRNEHQRATTAPKETAK